MIVTREYIKDRIDLVSDQDLGLVYDLVQTLTNISPKQQASNLAVAQNWHDFLEEVFGMFEDIPFERPEQWPISERDTME